MDDDWVTALSNYSSTREKILEHRFISEVTAELWRRGHFDFAVSHSEVDNSGYDLIIEAGAIVRHIQLKAVRLGGARRDFDLQRRLQDKPSGCAVLMLHDLRTLAITEWRFFGGPPGCKIPDLGEKVTRHSKGDRFGFKADRPALRNVPLRSFDRVAGVSELVDRMFGEISPAADVDAALEIMSRKRGEEPREEDRIK